MDREHPPRAADVLLSDGRIASIRPLVPGDRDELVALHDGIGEDSLRMRFFTLSRTTAHRYVEHLLTQPNGTVAALVATVADHLVAVVTAERVSPDAAEIAFLVADREHGHGLGSLLLEHVAAACRSFGIRRFVAEVLPENAAMLGVLTDAGFEITRRTDHGVVLVEMSTEATARALEAADARESASEARSLTPLLYPRNVVLIGVRSAGGGLGHAVLRSVLDGGFAGTVHVVHPAAESIAGLPAHRSACDIPEHVDLAVVTVPAAHVLGAVEDAAAAGVSAAVVITSGLAELGAEGADIQRRMLRVARRHDLRLVGPNCLGLMCNDPQVRLNATFTDSVPPAGGLAVASQSGGVGIALLDVARELGVGVHAFVSLGNKADVSGNDLLAAWLEDTRVTGAALYLESFGNPRKFARVARRFATRKPLLAVVGGRSASGRRAGASHTAAAATPAVGVDALFAQAGVIGCRSAEAMSRTVLLLEEQPLPVGRRLGVVTNAGGLGVLAADAAAADGLLVPELSAELRAELAGLVRVTTGTSNPVDLGAGATAEDLGAVVDRLLATDEIDVLLVVLVPTTLSPAQPLVDALARHRAAYAARPVVLVGLGGLGHDAAGVTTYRAVDHAVEAIGHAVRYGEWRRTPPSQPPPHDRDRAATARQRAAGLLPPDSSTRWLGPREVAELLGAYGLAPIGASADDPLQAAEAAERAGFPVALKVADPSVVHKTDRGLVRVGLRSAHEVLAAARSFAEELGVERAPVLVQPMVDGVEIALGVTRDPGFGPLVMLAAGGIATDLLGDRAFLLPPVSRQDAARAVRSLRSWPLLHGYRGAPPADVDSLERLVVALGELSLDVPHLAELDANPVMCRPDGAVLVDVKVGLRRAPPLDDEMPRQLRGPA